MAQLFHPIGGVLAVGLVALELGAPPLLAMASTDSAAAPLTARRITPDSKLPVTLLSGSGGGPADFAGTVVTASLLTRWAEASSARSEYRHFAD